MGSGVQACRFVFWASACFMFVCNLLGDMSAPPTQVMFNSKVVFFWPNYGPKKHFEGKCVILAKFRVFSIKIEQVGIFTCYEILI